MITGTLIGLILAITHFITYAFGYHLAKQIYNKRYLK
jgi:hypothetical protein